jgi:hypothetical protein
MKRPRKEIKLPSTIDRQLSAYALAASVAGVGILALAEPAEAKIVYTKTDQFVVNSKIYFDLNQDGKNDFSISGNSSSQQTTWGYSTVIRKGLNAGTAQGGNAIWSMSSGSQQVCAAALPSGVLVGPRGRFKAGKPYAMAFYFVLFPAGAPVTGCPWVNKDAFLGLKFLINGKTHYGWAGFQANVGSGTLTGYAYETVPNKPIFTGQKNGPVHAGKSPTRPQALAAPAQSPQPATLGALALGAPGLAIWRRGKL